MVAAAHAFVGRLAAVAAFAGLDLNSIQRAVIGVSAMVFAALYTAADVMVRILLRHDKHLLKFCLLADILYPKRKIIFNVKNGIF